MLERVKVAGRERGGCRSQRVDEATANAIDRFSRLECDDGVEVEGSEAATTLFINCVKVYFFRRVSLGRAFVE